MKIIHVDTLNLPELDVYARLTESQLRNRLEPEKGIFIAESLKVVRVALQKGLLPISFLAEEKYVDEQILPMLNDAIANSDNESTKKTIDDATIYTGDREVLAQLTGYELSRGFLCAMHRPQLPSVEDVCAGKRRIAVMDGVVNSTNTGAIFRAATALGIEALLLTPTCCDPLNRRSVRVSMGTVFQISWTYINDLSILNDIGFATIALALSNKAVSIDDPTLLAHDRLAIVMGTEGDGLSQATINKCTHVVMIPMQRGVDSLNVAAAAAVAFWQLRCR
ncbi:MAG: RNA methyltransferase [Bacteroidales bacterium]|nr:RNA methyltransferase [Bacteroidales bacterium]